MTCLACFRATVDNEQDVDLKCREQQFGPFTSIGPPMHPEPPIRYMPRWSLREDFYPTPRPHKCQWRHARGLYDPKSNIAAPYPSYPLKREWRDNEFRGGRIYWVNVKSNLTDKNL